MMHTQAHPHGEAIVAQLATWATAADEERPLTDTERQWIGLRAKAPLQSKGKPVEDPSHLPLFVAANEPTLI